MDKQVPTIWGAMKAKGYNRREFMYFVGVAIAAAGLERSGFAQVVDAFEKKARPPVVWLHFQECTCCSESFIRSSHPIVADVIFDTLSLDYTEPLQAAAGTQAEKSLKDPLSRARRRYPAPAPGRSASSARSTR